MDKETSKHPDTDQAVPESEATVSSKLQPKKTNQDVSDKADREKSKHAGTELTAPVASQSAPQVADEDAGDSSDEKASNQETHGQDLPEPAAPEETKSEQLKTDGETEDTENAAAPETSRTQSTPPGQDYGNSADTLPTALLGGQPVFYEYQTPFQSPTVKQLAPPRRLLLRFALGLLTFTAIAGIVAIAIGGFGMYTVQVFETALLVAATAFLSLCYTRRSASLWTARIQVFGFVSAIVAMSYGSLEIWDSNVVLGATWVNKVFGVAVLLAVLCAQTSVLAPMRRCSKLLKWLTLATLWSALVFTGLAICMMFGPSFASSDGYLKFVGAFLILNALGTILVPVLRHYGAHIARLLNA